jgi:hypothetical protein
MNPELSRTGANYQLAVFSAARFRAETFLRHFQ